MENALSDLEKYIHGESLISKLVKIALVHYQFETIHPFLDGSGRIGRLLIVLFLIEQGLIEYPVLYLSYFFKKNRAIYYELLNNVNTKGEFEERVSFFIKGICEVSEDAISSIQKIRKATKGNVSNLLAVYDYLLKHPILEAKDICNFLNLSKLTVNNLLETLTDLGILELLVDKKRYKQYVYSKESPISTTIYQEL